MMLSDEDVRIAKARAADELRQEEMRRAVAKEKERLQKRTPLLHRLFPWKISVTRR